jgi:hypothetical protein
MPDITDLHAAFAELEAQAPTELRTQPGPASSSADLVHAPAPTNGRPRRLVPVLAAAGAVAATVAALVIAPNLTSGSPARPNAAPNVVSALAASPSVAAQSTPVPAVSSALSLTTSYYSTGSLPDGFIVTYDEHTATTETLLLGTGGDVDHNAMVQVVIATSAAAQPVAPADATAVTVNGRPGQASTQFRLPGAAPKAQPVTGVLWTDAAGRIVFAYHPEGDHPDVAVSATTLLATANALQVGTGEAGVTTPVKFGYLPARSALNGVTVGRQKFDQATAEVSVTYDHLILTVMPGTAERGKFGPAVDQAPQTTTIHVNGFSGLYSPEDSTAVVDNGAVLISIDNYNGKTFVGPGLGLSLDEVTKILNAVTVTPTPANASTWFDLATALP